MIDDRLSYPLSSRDSISILHSGIILVSFWYGQSRRGSQHSCQKAQKSPGTLRYQGFPHEVSIAFHGGDKRDRTADLLNAIQALSQLSYTPILCLTGQRLF